jgi:hypothetical protein
LQKSPDRKASNRRAAAARQSWERIDMNDCMGHFDSRAASVHNQPARFVFEIRQEPSSPVVIEGSNVN